MWQSRDLTIVSVVDPPPSPSPIQVLFLQRHMTSPSPKIRSAAYSCLHYFESFFFWGAGGGGGGGTEGGSGKKEMARVWSLSRVLEKHTGLTAHCT